WIPCSILTSKVRSLRDTQADSDTLAELHEFEADVAVNLETGRADFYVVVEAPDPREAFANANRVIDRALAVAGVGVEWNEARARRADHLIPV
ncbi:MAG: hypothetical protein ACRDZW_04375, partial [Acidimicrobiales bacterium]